MEPQFRVTRHKPTPFSPEEAHTPLGCELVRAELVFEDGRRFGCYQYATTEMLENARGLLEHELRRRLEKHAAENGE